MMTLKAFHLGMGEGDSATFRAMENVAMTNAWDRDQPAVLYVRELVWQFFPAVGMHHDSELERKINYRHKVRDHPARGVGGRVVRTTAAGGFSRHSEGRAADIYCNIRNAYLKRFGDEVFDRLANNARLLESVRKVDY